MDGAFSVPVSLATICGGQLEDDINNVTVMFKSADGEGSAKLPRVFTVDLVLAEAREGWPHAIHRAMEAEARVAELEAACTKLQDICQDWMERAQNAEALLDMLDARLQAAERVVEAARLAREELRYAPCRDNPQHTLCLKCAAEKALDEALAAWEEAKRR